MAGVQLAAHSDSLPHKIGAFFQGLGLRSPCKNEGSLEARNLQLKRLPSADQGAVHSCDHLRRRKPRIFNRLGNQGRVERSSWLREHLSLSLHETNLGTANAIQALQGLLGPVGSKASYHPVDFDGRLYHLC